MKKNKQIETQRILMGMNRHAPFFNVSMAILAEYVEKKKHQKTKIHFQQVRGRRNKKNWQSLVLLLTSNFYSVYEDLLLLLLQKFIDAVIVHQHTRNQQ